MQRNINLNYRYTFLQYFVVTGLWVLYLTHKGFTSLQIGLLEAVFHGTSFLFEVPSGGIGDRFGYRKTLIVARVMNSISCLLTVLTADFWLVSLGFVFSALSYNLASGTNEALVYESLRYEKQEQRYLTISANLNALIELASSAGIVIAGLMSDWFFDGVYWVQIMINLLGIAAALQFTEPPKPKQLQQKYFTLMKSAFSMTKQISGLATVMLSFAFLDSLNATYYFYFQNYFARLGLAGFGISLVIVVSSVFQIIGTRLAPVISRKWRLDQLFLRVLVLLAIGISFSGFLPAIGVIVCYILVNTLAALVNPVRSNYINQLIPSGQRATINSIDSLCFSLLMIPFFPLAGVLIHQLGYPLTFLVLSGAVILGGTFGYTRLKKVFL